ncbi:cobalamin biosynthesis protein [Marine Group I thaumarchaeote]|jgi:adenosylcobinamide-phosphate synthase|uniref:Probable cobalamin biosynthesis protein CobD n=1 Tax=Marine Group I thaumarchaeote TaxID=2511932 RepID=A0A7K4M982_9ARCH|nr:MAG: cobalamin biosynthesis protein [Nitrosopumilus sp. YT1]NMI82917.1 cobalamin biosynthesis protein [Candidatus Nitrosopumilus sp. MTA1]NWJ20057.1 cobalamin biosynthesis protein [Marine Group I thaumarchaeote]NWJ27968.1 cobalamin biosynthesis protein [Marine Group I thaumarchaeote]NWJ29421.1 cobalamin biosynthesis protein [Marine Group I thaumarchaeote]
MILEPIVIVAFALGIDFVFGDPKNKYHPTAWIGTLIAKLTPLAKNQNMYVEKLGGIFVVVITVGVVVTLLLILDTGISLLTTDWVTIVVSGVVVVILLKTTIAIRGMEKHVKAVLESLDQNNLDMARTNLSMIVKRNTKNLDKNHVISGVLESISENTVDGVTGPLFYFALFGLPGAFVYRVINTVDSMIGYKTDIFKNIGWFGATCDTILNYIPSRLTGLVMIISAAILQNNWKESYKIMIRDGKKTESPNAGYPMAALAGALETKFEKINHYKLGNGEIILTTEHVNSALTMMKLTSILFFGLVIIPIITVLSLVGWWIHA